MQQLEMIIRSQMQSHSFSGYANVIITGSQQQFIEKLIRERKKVQKNPQPPKLNVPFDLRGMNLEVCVQVFHA